MQPHRPGFKTRFFSRLPSIYFLSIYLSILFNQTAIIVYIHSLSPPHFKYIDEFHKNYSTLIKAQLLTRFEVEGNARLFFSRR